MHGHAAHSLAASTLLIDSSLADAYDLAQHNPTIRWPQPHRQPRRASLAVERICACNEEGHITSGYTVGVSDGPQRGMGAGVRNVQRMNRARGHLPAGLGGA